MMEIAVPGAGIVAVTNWGVGVARTTSKLVPCSRRQTTTGSAESAI